jgi:hypothetical protein
MVLKSRLRKDSGELLKDIKNKLIMRSADHM